VDPTKDDLLIVDQLKKSKAGKGTKCKINWPSFSEKVVSNYGSKHMCCMLFPWLCPGDNGDWNESRAIAIEPDDWAKWQLYLVDVPFVKDKQWCFYALNFVQRRRNQTQGSWFVDNWMKNEQILNLDDLKEKLKGKYTKFVEKLQYFSSVLGSDS
jgi:hypothetical protein